MNKVILIGNLAKDPDLRATATGKSVATFDLAVQRRFAGPDGQRKADFLPIVTWGNLADLCAEYLAKGRKVAVIGELQTRSYEAKDGTKRYVTEIKADEVEFLTPRSSFGPSMQASAEGSPDEARQEAIQAAMDGQGFTDIDDDDLPF